MNRHRSFKANLYEQFALVGKALASPARLELLDLIGQGERSVEDLALLHRLPRDREVVAYSRGPFCVFSHEAVLELKKKGFKASHLDRGLPDWRFADLPVVKSPLE
jgi:rhodanese-related sulfurtransferase